VIDFTHVEPSKVGLRSNSDPGLPGEPRRKRDSESFPTALLGSTCLHEASPSCREAPSMGADPLGALLFRAPAEPALGATPRKGLVRWLLSCLCWR
jgi:hypothetical protein